jgi:hypothetical protein
MAITITAENVRDVMIQLGATHDSVPIKITWKRPKFDPRNPFDSSPPPGCIVDATGVGESVPRSFDSMSDAIHYIAALLEQRETGVVR